jgi:hypothetical protein
VLVAGNLAGILVENKDSQFGARQLAVQAAEHRGETIFTDPMTKHRAELLLRWNRTTQQVSSEPPPPGSLYFHNPVHTIAANKKMPAERVALYQPQPGWIRVGARAPEPSFLARALETSGVAPMLPQGPWRKLRYRHPVVTLYRVGKPQD